jgi:hypothetical protein
MCREVLRSAIRLRLDDPADALPLAIVMHQVHSNELASNL